MTRTEAPGPKRAAALRTRPVIQSAARTVQMIALLLRSPEGFHLAHISAAMGLPKVTVLRLLQTLVGEGIVSKAPEDGRYRLNSLFWLAVTMAVPEARLVQDDVRRVLDSLARTTGAAASMAIPYASTRSMTVAAFSWPPHSGVLLPVPALAAPMHATAAGKCFLASLPGGILEAWLGEGLPAVTTHTITSPEALRRQLAEAHSHGYATHREEEALGVWGVAVPITDGADTVVAALQLSAPLSLMTPRTVHRWAALLQSASQHTARLLASLGRRPDQSTGIPH